MTIQSIDQAIRNQVKEELGDEENVSFKRKNMLLQKYGATPTVLTDEDKFCLELEEYHA